MSARKTIPEKDGVYFITFTCAGWLTLFEISKGYNTAYKWFDILKEAGHYIVGYGKRFTAYNILAKLKSQNRQDILLQLEAYPVISYMELQDIDLRK